VLRFIAKTFSLTVTIILLFVAGTYLRIFYISQKFETADRPEALAGSRMTTPQDAPYAQLSFDAQKLCGRVKLDEETSLLPFVKCVARQQNRVLCSGKDSKELAMLVRATVAKNELKIGQSLYFSDNPTQTQKQLSAQFLQDKQKQYDDLLSAIRSLIARGDLNGRDFAAIANPKIRAAIADPPRYTEGCHNADMAGVTAR
jgi:hypothetical protein